jgi:ubiquinone/menaquinone biosynthesis C-methylase UbiE
MEAKEYGRLSNWRDTARVSADQAREMDGRLELRARAADEASAREEYLELLAVSPGERVLDVGCGSGVVTRAIARRIAPDGRAVGFDASPALLDLAQRHARDEGLAGVIDFRAGDCRDLPFAVGSFDAVIAATVLAHVPGAERALKEMVRVTRSGGRVGVFDFDGDCFPIAHPDRELTRRIVAAQCDHSAVNGQLVRHLPGMLADLGVANVKVRGFMPLEREAGSFYAQLAERAGQTALKVRAITEAESKRWQEQLKATISAGRFLGGRLHLFVWGTRA